MRRRRAAVWPVGRAYVREFGACDASARCGRALARASSALCRLIAAVAADHARAAARPAAAQAVKGEVQPSYENGFARLRLHARRGRRGAGPPRPTASSSSISSSRSTSGRQLARRRRRTISARRAAIPTAGRPHRARAQGDGQLDGRRRAAVRRSAARDLDRPAARPAARRDRGAGAARARGREEAAAAARGARAATSWRRSGCGSRSQPTFTRYMFELPELIGVAAERGKDRLTLIFDALLQFDLADAKATLPPAVGAIDSELDQEAVVGALRLRRQGRRAHLPRGHATTSSTSTPVDAKQRAPGRDGAIGRTVRARRRVGKPPPPAGIEPPQTVPARTMPRPQPTDSARRPPQPPPQPSSAGCAAARRSRPRPRRAGRAAPRPRPPLPRGARRVRRTAPVSRRAGGHSGRQARRSEPRRAEAGRAADAPAPRRRATAARRGDRRRRRSPSRSRSSGRATICACSFRSRAPTPAAVFPRADTLWLVFDTDAGDRPRRRSNGDPSRTIRSATRRSREGDVAGGALKLERPRLVSVVARRRRLGRSRSATEVVEPTQAARHQPQHRRARRAPSITIPFDDPRQLHRLDGSRRRRHAAGRDRARARRAASSRPQDFVEFRALASAHGVVVAAARRRSQGRACGRQDRDRAARRADAVGSAQRRPRAARASSISRTCSTRRLWGFDRQAEFHRAQFAADPRRRRGAGRQAARRAARSRALLSRARDVRRGQGGARRRARRRAADRRGSDRARAARGRQHHARPRRRRRSRISPIRSSATSTTRRCGARWPMRARANGPRRAKASATSRRRWARCRSSCSASLLKDMRCAPRSRSATIAGAVNQLNEFETVGVPRELEPAVSVLTGRLAEGLGPQRRCAARLSRGRRFTGSAGRRAGPAARDRAARSTRRPRARPTSSPSSKCSPRSGAATRPRSRRCSCSRGSTPRRAATATPSTSCARRSRRIRIPT